MRRAVFRTMALTLLRDRGAALAALVLPSIVFLIFSVIFSGTSGGAISVRLALADEARTEASQRLVAALEREEGVRRVGGAADGAGVRAEVRRGVADVGVVVRPGATLERPGAAEPAIEIVVDPAREIAVAVIEGALQRAFLKSLPDAPVRQVVAALDGRLVTLTPEQRAAIEAGLPALREQGAELPPALRTAQVNVAGASSNETGVSYYAGAVAILFLLFTSTNGAISLLDERESGLLDRLATSPGGIRVLIEGKFLFLVCLGLVQVVSIFVTAWLVFGVDLPAHVAPFALVSLAAAVAAAGLALAFVMLCQTPTQAHSIAQVAILVVSAVGGSMVPRFLMPQWIQSLGWATPNTWAIEAYSSIFWRAEGYAALVLPWVALMGSGVIGLAVAYMLARRFG